MKKEKERFNERGITLIALIITIIIMLILIGVTINVAIQGGLFGKANEAKIETIIGMLKEEIWTEELGDSPENGTITAEQLLAKKKVGRAVEEEGQEGEEKYYLSYKIKDGAYESMQGLGKGVDKDIFLIDDNLNICYIDKKGRKYGDKDNVARTLLEDDTHIRFASKAFGEYVSKISGAKEEEMLFKWMKTQTALSISNEMIDSLEDLVFFPNLTSLSISTSTDKLKSLDGIENCKKLDYLGVDVNIPRGDNSAEFDYSAVTMLPNLDRFVCGGNYVTDKSWKHILECLTPVTTLKDFRSGGSGHNVSLTTIDGVGSLKNLETLTIWSALTEIKDLDKLNSLKDLSLNGVNMTKVEGLSDLKTLDSLQLYGGKIENIDDIGSLSNLKTLQLQANKITNISALSNLTNLKTLNLYENQIVDILPLASCNQLTYLNLSKNANIKVEGYTEEEKTKLLEIGKIMTERNGTITVDKEKLSLFNGYKTLDLNNQNLTNLSILKGQTELTSLNLANNQITLEDEESQNVLKGMKKLTTLNLGNNNLKDISAINDLTNLTDLQLGGNNNNVDLKQIEDRISNLNSFSVNETSFQTIVNCEPSKITRIMFDWHGYSGKLPEDLSKLTSLKKLDLKQCDRVTNFDVLSNVSSLEELTLPQCGLHERMINDFSKLTNLTFLSLFGNNLWTDELEPLLGLRNNNELTIKLDGNALIDPEILLQLPKNFTIYLNNNVNISEPFKAKAREYFNSNVIF